MDLELELWNRWCLWGISVHWKPGEATRALTYLRNRRHTSHKGHKCVQTCQVRKICIPKSSLIYDNSSIIKWELIYSVMSTSTHHRGKENTTVVVPSNKFLDFYFRWTSSCLLMASSCSNCAFTSSWVLTLEGSNARSHCNHCKFSLAFLTFRRKSPNWDLCRWLSCCFNTLSFFPGIKILVPLISCCQQAGTNDRKLRLSVKKFLLLAIVLRSTKHGEWTETRSSN